MKFVQLAKSLKEGLAPVYLIEGEEAYFRDHAVAAVRAACGIANPMLNDVRYEGETLKGEALGDLAWAGVDLGLDPTPTQFTGYDRTEDQGTILATSATVRSARRSMPASRACSCSTARRFTPRWAVRWPTTASSPAAVPSSR